MFEGKVKADVLREVVDVVSTLVDEAKFNVGKDSIIVKAVDPAHVAMVDLTLDRGAFDAYKADDGEEFVATRTHRISHTREEEESPRVHRRSAHAREDSKDDEEEEPAEAPPRHAPVRSQAEERAIQRFVERALRNYDHAKL